MSYRVKFSLLVFILPMLIVGTVVGADHSEPCLNVDSFAQAVIPNVTWEPSESQMNSRAREGFIARLLSYTVVDFQKRKAKKNAPWLLEYMGRTDSDLPDSGVISKWPGKIEVGFDWPPYSDKCEAWSDQSICVNEYSNRSRYNFEKNYRIVESQVNSVLNEISILTRRPVKFYAPDSPEEKTQSFAKIRIVLVTNMNQRNFFKFNYKEFYEESSLSDSWTMLDAERYLWGAVPFTPYSRSQVEGYLLLKDDNSIGMAVCKIMPNVKEKIMRKLINECIVRSLGIPNLVDDPDSLLGPWNASFDSVSMLESKEGKKATARDMGNGFLVPMYPEDIGDFPASLVKEEALGYKLSYLDKKIIELLYRDEIKSGLTFSQVKRVLGTSCL